MVQAISVADMAEKLKGKDKNVDKTEDKKEDKKDDKKKERSDKQIAASEKAAATRKEKKAKEEELSNLLLQVRELTEEKEALEKKKAEKAEARKRKADDEVIDKAVDEATGEPSKPKAKKTKVEDEDAPPKWLHELILEVRKLVDDKSGIKKVTKEAKAEAVATWADTEEREKLEKLHNEMHGKLVNQMFG